MTDKCISITSLRLSTSILLDRLDTLGDRVGLAVCPSDPVWAKWIRDTIIAHMDGRELPKRPDKAA